MLFGKNIFSIESKIFVGPQAEGNDQNNAANDDAVGPLKGRRHNKFFRK
jgi:hypothetical protein